jgi:hypothetical protein
MVDTSQTIGEFCRAERISKSVYYELKARGLNPDEFEIPGTRIKRITPEARAAWRERMAELAKSETAQLEAERRRELASIAGRAAAASPRHISKRVAHKQEQQQHRRRGR